MHISSTCHLLDYYDIQFSLSRCFRNPCKLEHTACIKWIDSLRRSDLEIAVYFSDKLRCRMNEKGFLIDIVFHLK